MRFSFGGQEFWNDKEVSVRWNPVKPPLATLVTPNKLYVRYRHSYGNRLSYGITAEKDRGEAFFRENNANGFDFYSAHLYLRNYNQNIKAIALGDYAISLGQGLILFSGFGGGKSSSPMLIKRTGRVVRPYTSVNEASFLRGGATTLNFGNFDLSLFASSKKVDGNLTTPDTTEQDDHCSRIHFFGSGWFSPNCQ